MVRFAFVLYFLVLGFSQASYANSFKIPLSFPSVGSTHDQDVGCLLPGNTITGVRVSSDSPFIIHSSTVTASNPPIKGTTVKVHLLRTPAPSEIPLIANGGATSPVTSWVEFEAICAPYVSVLKYGAAANGVDDDTVAIQAAIDNTPPNGVLYFPSGKYLISDTLKLLNRIQLKGDGVATQVFQSNANASVFDFSGLARGVSVDGFWLGSMSTAPGTALIHLHRAHYSKINNITMGGSYYGIWAEGSIGVEYRNIRSHGDMGYPGFFQDFKVILPIANTWFYSSRAPELRKPDGTLIEGEVASNASILVNPILRLAKIGIFMEERGFGNITIQGGIIESNAEIGLKIERNGHPISVHGTHFENNPTDILIESGYGVSLDSIHATHPIKIQGVSIDVSVEDSNINQIEIGPNAVRTRLTNTIVDKGSVTPAFVNQSPDTLIEYVGTHRSGASRDRSTIGIGTTDVPNSATAPHGKIHVEGCVVQTGANTSNVATPCP